MNGELKDFVLRKQDEHTKNLALFKTFERIRYFGKNVFIIGGIDDPDDSDLKGHTCGYPAGLSVTDRWKVLDHKGTYRICIDSLYFAETGKIFH